MGKKLLLFCAALVIIPVIAGVYGALHDQVSFTIAPEYFTRFIGLFLGGTALLQPDALSMRRAIMRGVVITLCIAVVCALAGLAHGWFFLDGPPQGWFLPAGVLDPHAFLAVGSMHNASYGGGVLGLLLALTDMEWWRNKHRASRSGKQRGLPLAQKAP
jgi:hypothetical protein